MARASRGSNWSGRLKRSHLTAEQLDESSWEPIALAHFARLGMLRSRRRAPSHKRERLYLAPGSCLPVWDKLPSDFVRVSRISASDGRSLLGREVPVHCVPELCRPLGLSANRPSRLRYRPQSVLTRQAGPMEVKAREQRSPSSAAWSMAQRLELTGWSAARLDWYKAQGFTEMLHPERCSASHPQYQTRSVSARPHQSMPWVIAQPS
jgi:hypothetical protein